MKKIITLLAIAILSIITFASCSSSKMSDTDKKIYERTYWKAGVDVLRSNTVDVSGFSYTKVDNGVQFITEYASAKSVYEITKDKDLLKEMREYESKYAEKEAYIVTVYYWYKNIFNNLCEGSDHFVVFDINGDKYENVERSLGGIDFIREFDKCGIDGHDEKHYVQITIWNS